MKNENKEPAKLYFLYRTDIWENTSNIRAKMCKIDEE